MAELIATGTTEVASTPDFTLAAGDSTTLFLKDGAGPTVDNFAIAHIQILSGTEYFTVATLDARQPAVVLQAAGTFRVVRRANPNAFGVDRV